MTQLSVEEIEHIASLSRLELTQAEKELYAGQLSAVLGYVKKLNEVDTDNVEETANVTGLSNIYRKDAVEPSGTTHGDIAKNAPEFDGNSFVVPGVFE